jgi:hypothetical protein
MPNQFCWTRCGKYYNFLFYSYGLILDIFSMKNKNVKKLDLQYLKIYKSLVSNFCIFCVLGHD